MGGLGIGKIIDQIARIIANPGSNLAGAMLLLAMVVLVLLILAIGALITILPGEDDEEDDVEDGGEQADSAEGEAEPVADHTADDDSETSSRPSPRDGSRRIWLSALPVVLLVAAAVSGWYVTSQPASCGSCHATAPALKSWRSGDHAAVRCVACHEDGGLALPAAALQRVSDVYAAVAGGGEVSGARRPVASRRCLRCHARIERETVRRGAIKVSHKEFLSLGFDCVRCHEGVGHGSADTPQRAVDMNHCVSCHDGKTAASECDTCHVGDTSGAVRVNRSVFPRADITPPPGCRGCHSTKSCDDCHGLEMPHPKGFETAQGHAKAAAFERKELCWRCHVKQDCRKCHRGDFNAHAPNWKVKHPSGVPLDGRAACGCHNTANFCGLCHETGRR